VCQLSIYNSFPFIRTTIANNRHFYVPRPSFLFALGSPLRQSRKTLHEWKDNSVLAKPIAACTLEQFPSYSNRKCKQEAQLSLTNRAVLVCKVVEVWQDFLSEYVDKKFSYICYRRLIRHGWIYYGSKNCVIYNSYMCNLQQLKNRRFYVPQPTFLFPLETPLRLSRNMLHGWKDNSMFAKPLAAFTYLSSIVCKLYDV